MKSSCDWAITASCREATIWLVMRCSSSCPTTERADADIALRRPGLVADAADRHDDVGPLRVTLDLGPQALHVDVDEPGVGRVPVPPDLLEQHLPGEDLPRLAGERDEKVELQRRQGDDLPVPAH